MGLGSGIRDPGSGKNPFRIPDPGVKKAPDPGSATLGLRICLYRYFISDSNLYSEFDPDPSTIMDTVRILTNLDPQPWC